MKMQADARAGVPEIVIIKHPDSPSPPTMTPAAPIRPLVFISPNFRSTSTQATDGSSREAPRAATTDRHYNLCNRYADLCNSYSYDDLRRKAVITVVNFLAAEIANFVSGTAGFIFNQHYMLWVVNNLDYTKFMFAFFISNITPSLMLGAYLTPQLQAKQKIFDMLLITIYMPAVEYLSAHVAAWLFNLDSDSDHWGFTLAAATNGTFIFMALMSIIIYANEYATQRCCPNNRARNAETNEDTNPRSSSETDARSTPRPR